MTFPQQFGRYQLVDRIAVGGMAEVYLARSFGVEGFEKRLVIKRILPELAQNQRFVNLFVQEAKLSVCLNHPNIVQVYDLGKVGDDHYMAMEYIHGRDLTQTLRALRRSGEKLPVPIACSIAASVARGLGYAHARTAPDGRPLHIVHRDVSPHNVVVSFEGDVKLVDFGIARLIGDSGADQQRGPGGGKFAYMSPEQAAGKPVDQRSDLFSLGVVLWEMLVGRRLFQDADPDEKLRQVVECRVPPVRELRDDVPEGLAVILGRALTRDPAERYPDALRFEEDLRALLYETGARHDAAPLRALMHELFPDEARGSRGAADLDLLAEDLGAMHTGADSEPSAPSIVSSAVTGSTHSTGDERGPRLLAHIRGEKRPVVVLVAEANGLTDLSAQAEVEEIAGAHYRMLRMVRSLVDRMGGVAERFDDDTLTVFFGLPRSLGDDLERALACARELHRLAARLRRRNMPMEFSVGVHVGELTVSRRAGRHYRYTSRGDTTKHTMRLAWCAEPGTTLVSDRVAALAGDRFPFDRGPVLRRKGTRQTRPTFLLAGGRRHAARATMGRWQRRLEELEVLRSAIGALKDGHGSRVGVRGPPGSGKSRLVRELRELARRRNLPVFQGRAFPHSGDRPFAAFRDLLADILGIRPETDAAGVRARLERLGQLGLDTTDAEAAASLFGLELGERRDPPRDAMFGTAARLVKGLAADGPVIVIMEDIQYFDPFEREMWARLVDAAEGEPVLAITTWRGELPYDDAPTSATITLASLSPEQVATMSADLLGADRIGPDLTALVLRSAEGNPLYLEEILKALQQAGRIWYEGSTARLKDPRVDPGLPDTLQGLITARIDALEPASRGALQVAAVIGMSFPSTLLGAAVGAEDPTALVGELVRAGLIVPESPTPETPYTFASVLVWECVLRSILGIQRRDYHRMVAAGMERVYGDRIGAVRESFAHHAHAGGRTRDAALALSRVGDGYRAGSQFDRALDAYQQGLRWIQQAPRDQQDAEVEALLHLGCGEVSLVLRKPRAQRHLQLALDLVAEGGPAELEQRAMLALGQLYLSQGKAALARAHLDTAASMARRMADAPAQVHAIESLGVHAANEGRIDDAAALYAEGLRMAGEDPTLRARMLLGQATLALRRDDNTAAVRLLTEALPLAERAGDRILAGRIVNNLGLTRLGAGDTAGAIDEFRRAIELRAEVGYRMGEVINLHNLGDAWLRAGNHAHAWASFEKSRELAAESAYEPGIAINDVYLCTLRGLRGDEVLPELDRACAEARRVGEVEVALTGQLWAARLLRRANRPAAPLLAQLRAEAEQLNFPALVREIDAEG